MPEHNVEQKGGTMRLGERVSYFKDSAKDSVMYKLYGEQKGRIEGRLRRRNPRETSSPL